MTRILRRDRLAWLVGLLMLSPLAGAQQPRTVTQLDFGEVYGYANADFNGDGLIDHFATGHDPDAEVIWFTQPDRSFVAGPPFEGRKVDGGQIDRHGCAAADFNLDGRMDLFCSVGASNGTGRGNSELWLQGEDGRFERNTTSHGATDPYGRGRHPVAFNFNGDAAPDLYVINEGEPRDDGRPNINHVYINDGTGKFTEVVTTATLAMEATCQGKGDVNGDGLEDLFACPLNSDAQIYVNDGNNNFSVLALPMVDKRWWSARLARINKDARDDLVVTTHAGQIQVFLNTGKAQAPFKARPDWSATLPHPNAISLAVGDLDGDKLPDFYVVMRQVVDFTGPDCADRKDTVDDVVFMSKGNAGKGWKQVQLVQGYKGCGYAADYLGQRRVALSQGGTGWNGNSYVLDWRKPPARAARR